MCGLFGIIYHDKSDRLPEEKIVLIQDALKKRGPDYQGHFSKGNCTFIHTRLAILDLDARSNQPFISRCGRYVMVYNGEVYNFLDLKRELESAGHYFVTTSDTEVILAAYIQYGNDCFAKLEGMFALAIYDLQTDDCVLVRDPVGIKPLYYSVGPEALVFGSDINTLLLSDEVPRKLNVEAVQHYLHFAFAGLPQTLVQNVFALQPGCYWSSRDQKVARYFHLDVNEKVSDLKIAMSEFESIFAQSVKRSLVSDVDVGILLSGGIDSSLIAAYAVKIYPQIKSYSLGFSDKSYDETDKASQIAQKLGIQHEVILFDENWHEVIEDYVLQTSDPISDSSILATSMLCREVAKRHKVVLSGDGADELFGGYELYRLEGFWKRYPSVFGLGGFIFNKIGSIFKTESRKNSLINRLKRIFTLASDDFVKTHLSLRSQWNTFDLDNILNADNFESLGLKEVGKPYADWLNLLPSENVLVRSLCADFNYHLPGDMLVKMDRASMAHSLEVRVPFLNASVVRFAFSLASSLKLRGITLRSKYLLRKLYEKNFGMKLARQKKSGFSVPTHDFFVKWLCSEDWQKFGGNLDRYNLFKTGWKDQIKAAFVNREHQIDNGIFSLMILDKWLEIYLP